MHFLAPVYPFPPMVSGPPRILLYYHARSFDSFDAARWRGVQPRRTRSGARSQPAPPPPMLRNGGSGAACSLHPVPPGTRALARAQPRRTSTRARSPQSPPPPMLAQRGFRGPAACVCGNSTSPPLRAVEHALTIRTSAEQPARQAPCNPGLSRWLLPLAPVPMPHRFATTKASSETNASRTTTPPRPLRSGAFTMQ